MNAHGALVVVVVLVGVAVGADEARACSIAFEPHVVDPAEEEVDVETPADLGTVEVVAVRRGARGLGGSSCGDIARIALAFTPPVDDRTPVDAIGYRVDVVSGDAPPSLAPIGEAVHAPDGALSLVFVDQDAQLDATFTFVLRVSPIDLAGNEGAAGTVGVALQPASPIDDDGLPGCAAVRAPTSLLFVAVVLGLGRRERARARAPRGGAR